MRYCPKTNFKLLNSIIHTDRDKPTISGQAVLIQRGSACGKMSVQPSVINIGVEPQRDVTTNTRLLNYELDEINREVGDQSIRKQDTTMR